MAAKIAGRMALRFISIDQTSFAFSQCLLTNLFGLIAGVLQYAKCLSFDESWNRPHWTKSEVVVDEC